MCIRDSLAARSPASTPFILFTGHIETRKNLGVLLGALAVDAHLPELRLVGAAKGNGARRLRALAKSLGVEERVKLLGPVTDGELSALLAGAHCAVFPSALEGFGLGPAEALRAGCPVVASDLPAHREHAGDAAAYCDPGEPHQFARAIREARAPTPGSWRVPIWDTCAQRWLESLQKCASYAPEAH